MGIIEGGVHFKGSESICSHCIKAYNCRAHKEDYKMTLIINGIKAEVSFKELFRTAQIRQCPIDEFEQDPLEI